MVEKKVRPLLRSLRIYLISVVDISTGIRNPNIDQTISDNWLPEFFSIYPKPNTYIGVPIAPVRIDETYDGNLTIIDCG